MKADQGDDIAFFESAIAKEALAALFHYGKRKRPEDSKPDVEAIKKFVPAWDGRYETREDQERFWHEAELALGFDCKTVGPDELPPEFVEASKPIILKSIQDALAKDSLLFNNPSIGPVQALKKLYQLAETARELFSHADSAPQPRPTEDGPWSDPVSPAEWSKRFNMSWDALKKKFDSQQIRNKKLTTKSYRVHLHDVPQAIRSD